MEIVASVHLIGIVMEKGKIETRTEGALSYLKIACFEEILARLTANLVQVLRVIVVLGLGFE